MSFKCRFATLDEAYNDAYYNNDNRLFIDKFKEGERLQKEKEKELEELRLKKIRMQREEEGRQIKEKEKNGLIEFKKKYGGFWKHPEFENCYVPIEIKNVPSKDKVNRISIWIQENGEYSTPMTLLARTGGSDLTEEDYFSKYCIKGDCDKEGNLNYYFVGDNINFMDVKNIKVRFKSIWKYILCHINDVFKTDEDEYKSDDDNCGDSDIDSDEYVIT
jgi:hypothetical protein